MDLISFPEVNAVYAKDQPEYRPLPCHRRPDGQLTCCWKLTLRERLRLLFTGKVWHTVLTFGHQLQPQLLEVNKPDMGQACR